MVGGKLAMDEYAAYSQRALAAAKCVGVPAALVVGFQTKGGSERAQATVIKAVQTATGSIFMKIARNASQTRRPYINSAGRHF